ncbi:hypothetical protein [Halobacteriovorax sp. RT-2-6]|uniref:hypothetical protein n=1 Tax=unclassified Halobacteriovorax TaxID=2639665 RepID=UPI00399B5947
MKAIITAIANVTNKKILGNGNFTLFFLAQKIEKTRGINNKISPIPSTDGEKKIPNVVKIILLNIR